MTFCRLEDGAGSQRGALGRAGPRVRSWVLVALLVTTALGETGCQSGPFGNCGGGGAGLFGPCGFFSRTRARIFNRNRSSDCCGEVIGAPVDSGTSSVVVPGTSSYSESGDATIMEPAPKSKITPQGSPAPGSSAAPTKSGATIGRPGGDSRLARGSAGIEASSGSTAGEADLFEHIPPLDLPGEATPLKASPVPTSQRERGVQSTSSVSQTSPPRRIDAELSSASLPPPESIVTASVGPGIARFMAVDLKLAGGSAPDAAGLAWLAEKGYRTLVDLRTPSETPPEFINQAARAGLRYVALPVTLATLDAKQVARFNFEIASGEARPTFFFDSDGARAGALWYIRRLLVDKLDEPMARREAEQVGMTRASDCELAVAYVNRNGGSIRPASTTPASPAQASAAKNPSATAGAASPGQSSPGKPPASPSPSARSADRKTPQDDAPPARPVTLKPTLDPMPAEASAPRDHDNLRPLAAMLVTGLCFPLAYLGRSFAPVVIGRMRASLPGAEHQPRSLPRASDDES